ncbi:hypothetical protein K3495_g2988 [Podosphaera aphanis]|nr:hypothetical protein K3495_g2988 [Podosphaera aphanis]
MHDTFINSVKEADFVRNGTAKGIMSLSKEHSKQLWHAVQDNDLQSFLKIQHILLNPPTPLRHIPIRLYVPLPPTLATEPGTFKVVQIPVPVQTASRETQTLGSALNSMLHSLFPSKKEATIAEPILHGSPVPFHTPLEELMREASYADGWLHMCVRVLDVER